MNDFHHLPVDTTVTHHKRSIAYTRRALWVVFTLLFIGATTRVILNSRDAKALEDYTATTLERRVLITNAKPGALEQTLRLPTSLRGNTESVIYARTNGYISAWHKGIGDHVKKGELLATIDSPEQEQELAKAHAEYEQIAARLQLTEQTLARWDALSQRESAISPQDLDEKRSAVRQSRADLNAAQANVRRLENLSNYRRIVAPFDGIVTRRSIEVGDYIAVGDKELFALSQTNPLRSTIWIPQAYADGLATGAEVVVNLREQQGAKLKARIERIAGGIDPSTRSRQVDLILANPDTSILPGAYAEVSIPVTSSIETLVVPAATLIIRDQLRRVAVVEADNTIGFRDVTLGRDLGRDVEVLEGITSADILVVSPPDQLVEKELVKTLAWQPAVTTVR